LFDKRFKKLYNNSYKKLYKIKRKNKLSSILNIAIVGLGTVGSGVVKMLSENKKIITTDNDLTINLVKVLDKDASRAQKLGLDKSIIVTDFGQIISDKSIAVVVELIGGVTVAKDFIERALNAKKSVVTANKDLMCKYGTDLIKLACKNGVQILFGASCCGTIPIISVLENNFKADKIISIKGIFNGTTNFILTKMNDELMHFDDALAIAQDIGFAEADPTSDVDGFDSAYKLCILSRIAFGAKINIEDVTRTGIRAISRMDIVMSKKLGYVIKLLAICKENSAGELELRVSPFLVPTNHQFATINGGTNSVVINGNYSGVVSMSGAGAGSKPTASSVVNDIISCDGGYTPFVPNEHRVFAKDWESEFFIKLPIADSVGTLAKIAKCFGDNAVSIDSCIEEKDVIGDKKNLVITLYKTSYLQLQKALNAVKKLECVLDEPSVIEIFNEDK